MKKIFIILGLSIVIISCSSKREDLIISGKINGIKKGKLYLQQLRDSLKTNLDSVSFYNNDDFSFSVELDYPKVLYLKLQKDTVNLEDDFISFFADKGHIHINADLNQFSFSSITADYENQKAFNTFSVNIKKFRNAELDLIQAEFEARRDNDNDKLDSVIKAYDRLFKRRVLYAINFAKANPNLEASPYFVINQAEYINKKYLDTVYLALDQNVKNSFYGKQLKTLIDSDD